MIIAGWLLHVHVQYLYNYSSCIFYDKYKAMESKLQARIKSYQYMYMYIYLLSLLVDIIVYVL